MEDILTNFRLAIIIIIFFDQQKTDIIDEGKVPRSTQEVDKRDQPKRN